MVLLEYLAYKYYYIKYNNDRNKINLLFFRVHCQSRILSSWICVTLTQLLLTVPGLSFLHTLVTKHCFIAHDIVLHCFITHDILLHCFITHDILLHNTWHSASLQMIQCFNIFDILLHYTWYSASLQWYNPSLYIK